MTPEQMSERLATWAATTRRIEDCGGGSLAVHKLEDRHVVCLEPDGPRRTWALYEGGRQVGLVRMRNPGAEDMEREGCAPEWSERMMRATLWTWEASDRTRAMPGLGEP